MAQQQVVQQTQTALAVGQVWRSPDGHRTRTVARTSPLLVIYAATRGEECECSISQFRDACKGWTLDAPAEEPTPCS